jgi:transcriptional regulator with XRE-family HTH domain
MVVGEKLKALRESKKFSQGEIQKRTGLLRSYVSRVENGHTVPSVDTLERWARALEIPIYQLFYEGDEPAKVPALLKWKTPESSKDSDAVNQFRHLLSRMDESDRKLLIHMAAKPARA